MLRYWLACILVIILIPGWAEVWQAPVRIQKIQPSTSRTQKILWEKCPHPPAQTHKDPEATSEAAKLEVTIAPTPSIVDSLFYQGKNLHIRFDRPILLQGLTIHGTFQEIVISKIHLPGEKIAHLKLWIPLNNQAWLFQRLVPAAKTQMNWQRLMGLIETLRGEEKIHPGYRLWAKDLWGLQLKLIPSAEYPQFTPCNLPVYEIMPPLYVDRHIYYPWIMQSAASGH